MGAPRHLGREVPRISLPILVAFLGPLSRPKLPSVFPGVPRYPFQRPGTNPTRPYRTPITRYIQKLPLVRRGYRSLFLCSMLCTCATRAVLTEFSPFRDMYAPSCALRTYLRAVWWSHLELGRGVYIRGYCIYIGYVYIYIYIYIYIWITRRFPPPLWTLVCDLGPH